MKKYPSIDEEKDFFGSYEECADYATLKKIWQAKEANATGLTLTSSKLKDLLPLAECTNLKRLFINKARVKDLSPLEDLVNLQILEINSSLITDISPLKDLINLRELSIAFTKVEDLTPLTNLTNLKILDASRSQVKDLSPLRKLTKLRILKLALTKVENIDILESLKDLEEIYLSSTLIQDISPLKALNNLKTVSISSTLITDLSPLQNLHLTRIIATSINGIDLKPLESFIRKNLPIKWSTLGNTDGIFVENSTFSNLPMEIVKLGNEAILRYWHELNTKEVQLNNQTKLIFVGNTRAGKTSVWKFLKDKIYQGEGDSTHGIKTEIWDTERLGTEYYQNLAVHIWDFGGQEYYHATHRLFLADNAVYVLVWEKDTNKQGTRLEKFKLDDDPNSEIEEVELEHFSVSYWLDSIRYFGGVHCPILIVQNKVDAEHEKANYTKRGQNLYDSFHISVQNAYYFQKGNQKLKRHNFIFSDFKERLLEIMRKNATSFPLVKYYGEVRKRLEFLSVNNDYITIEELVKIANEEDETRTPDLENLLAYLKSFTNTVLYFPQNEVLKDRLYLNPTHISRDIYKILNKTVRENNGKFDMAHIQTRLNCDVSEAERFVALMKEFDLIFEKSKTIKGETKRQFITPQYLPKKEDLSEDMQFLIEGYSFETAFTIQFKSFVPRSLMLRFIAENGALSNQETYWRNGIIYKSPTTPSMIKVEYDHDQSTFTICVQDKAKQTIDMQNIVEQFVKLENSDENIKISNDGKLYVDLRTIRKLQHETRGGDIYENGELIPLSKFDWLTQKIIKPEERMTPEQLKETAQTFIGKDKTKEAMEAVATWAHENNLKQLKDDINLLKGEMAALGRQETLGLLSFPDVSREKAKLNVRLLSLLNGIGDAQVEETVQEPLPKKAAKKKAVVKPTPKKILFLGANPFDTGKLNLKEEYAGIAKQLEDKGAKERLILKSEFCTDLEGFQEKTNTFRPNILHFAGHGSDSNGELEAFSRGIGRPDWKENIGLIFHKSGYGGAMLINDATLDYNFQTFIEDDKIPIEVLVLNACYSTNQAEVLSKRVKYVVGVHNSIDDNASIDFSAGFYYGLSDGKTIESAFRYGKGRAMPKLKDKNQIVLFIEGVISSL